MDSAWTQSSPLPQFDCLRQDIDTDVLIIGGGIAGLLCAYTLKEAGVDCILVEAGRLCGGNTGNTTAKITVQHGLVYDRLIHQFGLEKAQMYLHINQLALDRYRSLCQNIDCDFRTRRNAVYSPDKGEKIDKELEALQKIGAPAYFAAELPLPLAIAGAVCIDEQAQFHPLKFLSAVSQGLRIYENTRVLALSAGTAITEQGRIRAGKIIVATHFPFINKHGSYFIKLYQHRSYVLALQNTADVQGMYVDGSGTGLSFRNFGELLLLGGGGHRTGKNGGGWQELENFAAASYPASRIVGRWAAQDCMTLDALPYVGQYSGRTPDLYVSTGFNKWGMTSAMAAAMLLCDLILDRPNPFAELFSPSRSILRPQLALNAAESTLHILKPTIPRCTHMGCALEYNRHEHSWDCPCHGSRFTEAGRIIDNPAVKDLKR